MAGLTVVSHNDDKEKSQRWNNMCVWLCLTGVIRNILFNSFISERLNNRDACLTGCRLCIDSTPASHTQNL